MFKIGLSQINNSFSGQNYLPYSVGLLQSYVEEYAVNPSFYSFEEIIYKREPINKIVQKFQSMDLVGFSLYVWNEQISLECIRRLKRLKNPPIIIVGGPQVPSNAKDFLMQNKDIDVVVHNEGEKTFLELLELYSTSNNISKMLQTIDGISFVDNGEFFTNKPRQRIREVEEIPSPFLNGVFDKIMSKNLSEEWIVLWETNRGCPFKCAFCDWGSATAAKVTKFKFPRLQKELKWMTSNKIKYIFVCDANFGMLPQDIEIAEEVKELKEKTGYPQGFSVQNTKNATERAYATQKIINDAGLNKGVALSMQSLDHKTLTNIKRDNISLETYFELSRRFASDNVETYSDLILGLPGETFLSFKNGIQVLLDSGQHNRIQFNNLSILPNAEMGQASYIKEHKMELVRSKVVNIHGERLASDDDVDEYQTLVVGTASLPKKEWVKTRAYSWLINFLYFNKILQLPLMLVENENLLNISDTVSKFSEIDDEAKYPILTYINKRLITEALSIQSGGYEYAFSAKYLNVYWPIDELIYIELAMERKLDEFYSECEDVILQLCYNTKSTSLIKQSIKLTKSMISTPWRNSKINVELNYNLQEFWTGFRQGKKVEIKYTPNSLNYIEHNKIWSDSEDWCRKIVWWGNKKGAYLGNFIPINQQSSEIELAGHF